MKAHGAPGTDTEAYEAQSLERLERIRCRMLALGAILGGLAVMAGAFAAHGLRNRLEESMLAVFEVGVRYQMYHALAIVAVTAGPAMLLGQKWTIWACWSWIFGVAVFSGSLYLLALTGVRWFGAITPFGGVALITGWALLVTGALGSRGRRSPKDHGN